MVLSEISHTNCDHLWWIFILRLNWGPKNVDFGKTHFWDPIINVRILNVFAKLKKLPGATLLFFEFSTTVPKNGPKNYPKFKKRQNGKLVSLKKNNMFFGVFYQNLGPRKFHFCLGKRPKAAND